MGISKKQNLKVGGKGSYHCNKYPLIPLSTVIIYATYQHGKCGDCVGNLYEPREGDTGTHHR